VLDIAVTGTTCVQFSSLVRVLLLVKAVVPEGILSVISRILALAV